MTQDISKKVRGYVVERFLFGQDDGTLNEQTSLVGDHVIDSTGVLELVQFLEETFSIRVDDLEMVPDNLDSIARIADFVSRKTAAPSAAVG